MKTKRIAGFLGISCSLIALITTALRVSKIEMDWSPGGSWELKTDKTISVGCGFDRVHYGPEERHVSFGPLQLHFPPTRKAIVAAERRNARNDGVK